MRIGIVALLLLAGGAHGQTVENSTFEVASVKAAPPQPMGRSMSFMRGGPGSSDPGQLTYTGTSLMNVVMRAYDLKSYQVSGPSWLESERYDITAKIPPGTTKEQFRLMLQNLLAERFHLTLHHESKELQGYEMVVGKNGPKMKESAPVDAAAAVGPPSGPAPMPGPPKMDANGFPQLDRPGLMTMMRTGDKGPIAHLTVKGQPISSLVTMLSGQLRRPVADKTGLTARYDFQLEYTPEGAGFGPANAPRSGAGQAPLDALADSGPTLQSAMQEQLGLKLESKKTTVDMLIIDSADKVPTEN